MSAHAPSPFPIQKPSATAVDYVFIEFFFLVGGGIRGHHEQHGNGRSASRSLYVLSDFPQLCQVLEAFEGTL